MERVFRYRSSEKLINSANKELSKLIFHGLVVNVAVFGLYFVTSFLIFWFMLEYLRPAPDWNFPIQPITILGIVVVLFYFVGKKAWPWIWGLVRGYRGFEFNSNLSPDEDDYAVKIDNSGVHIESKHGLNSTYWSGINRMSATKKFVFFHRRYDAVYIPIASFEASENVEELVRSWDKFIVRKRDEDETQ